MGADIPAPEEPYWIIPDWENQSEPYADLYESFLKARVPACKTSCMNEKQKRAPSLKLGLMRALGWFLYLHENSTQGPPGPKSLNPYPTPVQEVPYDPLCAV